MLLNVYGTVDVVSSSPLPLTAVPFYQLNFGEVRGIKVRMHHIIIKNFIHIENTTQHHGVPVPAVCFCY